MDAEILYKALDFQMYANSSEPSKIPSKNILRKNSINKTTKVFESQNKQNIKISKLYHLIVNYLQCTNNPSNDDVLITIISLFNFPDHQN
jgi:hypothetical protein